jgi:D-alanine-D-alanine ligase
MKKITVLFNELEENTSESENDTVSSSVWLKKVLDKIGYETEMVGVKTDSLDKINNIRCDLVFYLIEWTGENAKFAFKALDMLKDNNLFYTGSGKVGYGLSCDKTLMKQLFKQNSIPTPLFQIMTSGDEEIINFNYPVIVKPAREHCGVGVTQDSVADNGEQLRNKVKQEITEYKQPMIVEEFIEGREFHVTVLEKNGRPWVLPPAEVVFDDAPNFKHLLSYSGKWINDSWEWALSSVKLAEIDSILFEKIKNICETAYEKFDGKDYPRFDIRYDGKQVYVLEINNNPGIDYALDSGIGVSARGARLSEEGLVKHIVENAWYRWTHIK